MNEQNEGIQETENNSKKAKNTKPYIMRYWRIKWRRSWGKNWGSKSDVVGWLINAILAFFTIALFFYNTRCFERGEKSKRYFSTPI